MEIKKINRAKVEKFSPVDLAISKALYEKGAYCMNLAYKNNSKEMLNYSTDLLMESISLYPKNIEPYICLSYIALSVSQPNLAWKMIKSAEKLSPESLDVKALMEKIYNYQEDDSSTLKSYTDLIKNSEVRIDKIKLPETPKLVAKASNLVKKMSHINTLASSPVRRNPVMDKPLIKFEKPTFSDKPRVVSLGVMKPKELINQKSENSKTSIKPINKPLNSHPKIK